MLEEKGELDKPPSLELPSSSDTSPKDFAPLEGIEERLAKANSSDEITRFSLIRRTALSVGAITIGVGLIIGGFSGLGVLILGATSYELAPDNLKNIFSKNSISEEYDDN